MKRPVRLAPALALLLAPAVSVAYDNPTGSYLMVFHACDTTSGADCHQPANHTTYLAESVPGSATPFESFQAPTSFPSWGGSVPDVVKKGDNYYFFNAGAMRKYNRNTKTLSGPYTLTINGLAPGQVPTDTVAIVEPLTNHLKIFFMVTVPSGGSSDSTVESPGFTKN